MRTLIELPDRTVEVVLVPAVPRVTCPILVLNRLSGPPLTTADIHRVIDAFEEVADAACESE